MTEPKNPAPKTAPERRTRFGVADLLRAHPDPKTRHSVASHLRARGISLEPFCDAKTGQIWADALTRAEDELELAGSRRDDERGRLRELRRRLEECFT